MHYKHQIINIIFIKNKTFVFYFNLYVGIQNLFKKIINVQIKKSIMLNI